MYWFLHSMLNVIALSDLATRHVVCLYFEFDRDHRPRQSMVGISLYGAKCNMTTTG